MFLKKRSKYILKASQSDAQKMRFYGRLQGVIFEPKYKMHLCCNIFPISLPNKY